MHHRRRHLGREMQEKENCNIGIDWKRERGGGVTARLANSSQFDSSNWLGRRFLWKHLNKGLVDLARQFSLRHTKYITFVLLCLTQTNKPSLRLSISPKKGYVVKFSTVATEWLWGPQVPREWFWVRRSQGKYEGKFIDLEGVLRFKTSFALWRFQVPSRLFRSPCKINVRLVKSKRRSTHLFSMGELIHKLFYCSSFPVFLNEEKFTS